MATTINLEAPEKHFRMDQGSDFDEQFNLTQASVPLNMTGYTVRFQVRRTPSSDWIINGTIANGKIVWVDQSQGQFKIVLTASDTSSIQFLKSDDNVINARYDIEIVSPAGVVDKPCKGNFVIKREITR